MENTITQVQGEWYRAYRKVQDSGDYNMITESNHAALQAGLSGEQYRFVIENYRTLQETHGK